MKNALVDLRFSAFPRQASGDVVVIAIDPPSIEAIGVWPWPRRLHAELIEKLVAAKVSGIAFDVDFSTPSTPEFDRALTNALQSAGGSVILPSFQQFADVNKQKAIHLNRPLPSFVKHAWPAVVNISTESDGVVRRYPYGDKFDGSFLPSMGAVLAGRYEPSQAPLWIDFSIQPSSVPVVSFKDVLAGDASTLGRLKNKKVIVGGTALELGDRFSIPNNQIISGAVVQTLAAESILQDRALRPTSQLANMLGPVLVAILMLLLWSRTSAIVRVCILVAASIAAELGTMFLQAHMAIMADTSLLHVTVVAYLITIALDEIDLRDLISIIAERRFQRIAMSLGDGLVCADKNGLITVWNPTASAIFGYSSDEMFGRPLGKGPAAGTRRQTGGDFRATKERRIFPSRSLFLALASTRWIQLRRNIQRYIGSPARSRQDSLSRRI